YSLYATFVSAKVAKTICHPQKSSTMINDQIHRKNNHFLISSCLRQLRVTFPRILYNPCIKKLKSINLQTNSDYLIEAFLIPVTEVQPNLSAFFPEPHGSGFQPYALQWQLQVKPLNVQ